MATSSKIVLVTGGTCGIGRGTVEAALGRGWTPIIADLVGEGLPAGVDFVECDVADAAAVDAAVDFVVDRHGALHGLHANAGIVVYKPFLEMDDDTWRRTLSVNLDGVFHACRSAARVMSTSGGGALVVTSSVRGVATGPLHAAYTASKGGVSALVTALATELGPLGIRVNAILPGAISTPMLQHSADLFTSGDLDELSKSFLPATPLGRVGEPREVGEVATFLLSDEASYVTGAQVAVDGGLLTTLV